MYKYHLFMELMRAREKIEPRCFVIICHPEILGKILNAWPRKDIFGILHNI